MKRQVYILSILHNYEVLISLECAVDSKWNDVIDFIVLCSVVELIICRNHNNPAFNNSLTLHKTTLLQLFFSTMCCGAWSTFEVLDFVLIIKIFKWLRKCWSTSDNAVLEALKLNAWTHDWGWIQFIHMLFYDYHKIGLWSHQCHEHHRQNYFIHQSNSIPDVKLFNNLIG